MIPRKRIPTHPGEVLLEEFLKPLEVTEKAFAEHIGVPIQRIDELVRGRRGVSPEIAWSIAGALGTTPEFWMSLQSQHDLARSRPEKGIERLRETA